MAWIRVHTKWYGERLEKIKVPLYVNTDKIVTIEKNENHGGSYLLVEGNPEGGKIPVCEMIDEVYAKIRNEEACQ